MHRGGGVEVDFVKTYFLTKIIAFLQTLVK